MSSAYNHMKRSHRSERMKKTALAGFRPQPKPGGKEYHFYGQGFRWGLSAIRALIARKKHEKKEASNG